MKTENESKRTASTLVLAFILTVAGVLYLCNIGPGVVGTYHDDGIYVITAKALATGQGYSIISLPNPLPQTKYPFFYPYVLSLMWKIYPSFPNNILPMKLLSVVSAMLFSIISYWYLTKFRYASSNLALGITAAAAWCPWVVYFSSMVLSEMPYALLSVIVLYMVERTETNEPAKHKYLSTVIAAAVAAMACLTRSIGISLIASVFLYLLYKQRWARAAVFLFIVVLIITPWFLWVSIHLQSAHPVSELDAYYTNYARWFSHYTGGVFSIKTLNIFVKNLSDCFVGTFAFSNPLFMYMPLPVGPYIKTELHGLLVTATLLLTAFGLMVLIKRLNYCLRALDFYLISYLMITLIIPWPPLRYLVPLAPFILLFYFQAIAFVIEALACGLKKLRDGMFPSSGAYGGKAGPPPTRDPASSARKIVTPVLLVLMFSGFVLSLCIDILSVRDTLVYGLPLPPTVPNPGVASWSGQKELFRWIDENLPPDAVIAAVHDPMYYLYTGRRCIRGFAVNPLETYYASGDSLDSISGPEEIVQIFKGYHITHLILIPSVEPLMSKFVSVLSQKYPGLLTPVLRSPDDELFIFKINFDRRSGVRGRGSYKGAWENRRMGEWGKNDFFPSPILPLGGNYEAQRYINRSGRKDSFRILLRVGRLRACVRSVVG